MRCIKCTTKNINSANYCKKCGYKFSEKERKAARKWTFTWFLEQIENLFKVINLKIITDNIFFKIGSVIVVLAIGIFSWINYGSKLKILESDNYLIQYNTKLSEYYLLIDEDETKLNLYVPNQIESLVIKHMDEEDELIDEETYDDSSDIVLESSSLGDYYVIEGNDTSSNSLKIFVYRNAVDEDNDEEQE